MSRVGMANSFKYIKVVIYLWKMRLKQERHTVWLHFKRQVCIIPALIRFPEVQSFPGSPKLKTKQNKSQHLSVIWSMHTGCLKNICRDAGYELASKWIKIYPESATSKYSQWKPAFSETSAAFLRQLWSTMRCWEPVFCTSSRERLKNQPSPIMADKAWTQQRIQHLIKPSDEEQPQMLGWQGQGWDSLNGSSTAQEPFSVEILLEQRNR